MKKNINSVLKRIGSSSLIMMLVTSVSANALQLNDGIKGNDANNLVATIADAQTNSTNLTDKRIRVDITPYTGGRIDMYTQFWNNWIVKNGTSASITYNDVTFTLSNATNPAGGIKAGWYKGLVQSSLDSPTKTMDGVIPDKVTTGGAIKLQMNGLSAGTHTLATWHSFFDGSVTTSSSISVIVDGVVKASGIKVPTCVSNDDIAGRSYVSFTTTGSSIVIIKPEGNGAYDNAVLNAFEIDGADPFKSISGTLPKEGDEHWEQERGLSWIAGQGAVSHDVYIGTDFDSVNCANRSSSSFKGNQTSTTYALNGLSHMLTYWWRVDEIDANGAVTKGAVRQFRIAHLAFPGAEGYGRYARGGRGGRVIEVTNLEDSGPGSLRQAVEVEKGPRVVIFRVGGVIKLLNPLVVPNDGGDVYIAGQTAPGDGITLIQSRFGLGSTTDTIIRDVRLRVGDASSKPYDGMGMAGSNNCIIDHCSISWSIDEGTSSRGAHNITFQRNIIAEALNNSVHYNDSKKDHSGTQRHSFAASIGGNIGSFHHNLLTDCTGRNWSLAGGMEQDGKHYAGYLDLTNNVVYNFKDRTTDGGVRRINFVNNYYKEGPVSNRMNIFSIDGNELKTIDMQMAYLAGNKLVDVTGKTILDSSADSWTMAGPNPKFKCTLDQVKSDVPFFLSYVTTQTADEAYNSVLNDVGATKPKRDYLDTRYINEVKNGTYTYTGSVDKLNGIIDTQEDVGGYPKLSGGPAPVDSDHDGMPDDWETKYGLNPNDASDGNKISLSPEGYTNLEVYLDQLAGDNIIINSSKDPSNNSGNSGSGNTSTTTGSSIGGNTSGGNTTTDNNGSSSGTTTNNGNGGNTTNNSGTNGNTSTDNGTTNNTTGGSTTNNNSGTTGNATTQGDSDRGDKDHSSGTVSGGSTTTTSNGNNTSSASTNNIEKVKIDDTKITEVIGKALESKKDTATISVADAQSSKGNKIEVQISKNSTDKLVEKNVGLNIESGKIKVEIPNATLKTLSQDTKIDITEVTDPSKISNTKGLVIKTLSGSEVIGNPVEIETNYSGRTKVTIPLKGDNLPKDKEELSKLLDSLKVYVQHSDGKDETQKGEVIYDEKGNPVGISIWVDRFSTFTVVSVPSGDNKVATKTNEVMTTGTPEIKFVGLGHSPLVAGDKEDFTISSGFDGSVQYRIYLQINDEWKEVTNGYSAPVSGKDTFSITPDYSFGQGQYQGRVYVKKAGQKGSKEENGIDYENYYTYNVNCVDRDDANRVYTAGKLNTNKDTVKVGEKVAITGVEGISGIPGPYYYRLSIYDVANDKWINNVIPYSEKLEWTPSAPGTYVLDVHVITPNSVLWNNVQQDQTVIYGGYEGWRLKTIKVSK